MRLTVYLVIFSIFNFTHIAYSQTPDISLNVNNLSVIEVIDNIQNQSDYRFFYSDDAIDLDAGIDLDFKNASIEEVMSEFSRLTGLMYEITDDNLIILRHPEKQDPFVISGVVTSIIDNSIIPGVNVLIKGTTAGTITDFDGRFELEVPARETILVFSFVGYESQEVFIGNQESVNVSLVESVNSLEEIVVTALNISREKKSLGYAVSELDGSELNQAKEDNFVNSLSGKVAGLQITRSATGVGGSSRIVMRGISSMLGNNRPLFVIDGIPMDASHETGDKRWGGKDMGDALSDINPEDIESINVLKGAGAAAAYGSRGANGVILINTKKGAKRNGLGISFTSNYIIETPMVLPDLQNEYGQGGFGVLPPIGGDPPAIDKNDPWCWSYGPALDGTEYLDWTGSVNPYLPQSNSMESFLRNGSSFINTLAFENGYENSSFRVSLTNQNSNGLYPTNDLSRQTFNVRGFSRFNDNIEVDGKITYIHHKVNDRPYLGEGGANAGLSLTVMPRNIGTDHLKDNMYNENGDELTWTNDATYNNMHWALDHMHNNDEKNRVQSMMSMKIDFLKRFSFLARSGLDFTNQIAKEYADKGTRVVAKSRGNISQNSNNRIEWNSDFLVTYSNHDSDIIYDFNIGGNYRYNQYKSMNQSGIGMKVDDFFHISNYNEYSTGEYFNEKAIYSLYGLGQIAYKNYLYFDFSYRTDWSSTLPAKNNMYNYYSGNLSWLFSNTFSISNSWFTNGKLRGSIAKVGNDTGPYETQQYYSISQTPLPYPLGNISSQLAFFDFMPEETYSWEIGTNLEFFENKFGLDLTYYWSNAVNQIMNVPLLPSTGYSNKKMNAGEIQNAGLEIQLNGSPLNHPSGLRWDFILTFTKNNSKVVEIHPELETIRLSELWHADILAIPGEEYGVIWGIDYKRDNFGNKLIDENGFAQKGEAKIMGSINPDFLSGFSNTFSYKNISLSFLIDIHKGGDIYSYGKAYKTLYGTGAETLEGRAEWYETHDPETNYRIPIPGVEPRGYIEEGINENTGQQNDIPIQPMYKWFNLWNNTIITESILSATNVRLRELVISYSLPRSIIGDKFINNLVVSASGRNLFFIYKKYAPHIDPEAGYSSGNTGSGFEHSTLPNTRSYGFNLRMSF